MQWKGLWSLALLVIALAAIPVTALQSDQDTPAVPHGKSPASRTSTARQAGSASGAAHAKNPDTPADCEAGPCDSEPEHIAIATPAPAPAAWPWQERIAWVANLVLVILGYAAIALALGLLKKIERQTQYAEMAAQAAADTAQTVLAQAQAAARAERPWVLVTIEPSNTVENGFMVVATNRGRSAARLLSVVDKITIEADQASLPATPQYFDGQANAALASVILLPGESTGIRPFSRDEVKTLCGSDERLRKVEKWEEVILLYGQIAYKDLLAEGDVAQYESRWCCWYIHGRQNSGMVMAGSAEYNQHT